MSISFASASSSSTSTATIPPRVRVSRTGSTSFSLPERREDSDEDTNSTTTPKAPSVAPSPDATASRLKNLLSRASTAADVTTPSSQRDTGLPSPSEHESDFDEPHIGSSSATTATLRPPFDYKKEISNIFRSASEPPVHSPQRPRQRTSSFNSQDSPRIRDDHAPRSASDDDERERSSSLSLRLSREPSFDLLKDSMHIPDESHSRVASLSRELGPQPLPPSPDSPPRSASSYRMSSKLSSFETPRPGRRSASPTPVAPQMHRRPVSPTPTTASSSSLTSTTSSTHSLFDTARRASSSRHTTPASPERDKSEPFLPVELTTPARQGARAESIARERAAKAEQQQQQARASTPTTQTPIRRTRTPPAETPRAPSPAAEPPTPRFPGTFPATPHVGPTKHRRSPSLAPGDFQQAGILPSPTQRSHLTDVYNSPRTPAPPGRWVDTPGASARKKSDKRVRFEDELTASDSENVDPDVPIVSTPTPRAPPQSPGVRFVDPYGRPRQFAEDGTEIALPGLTTPTRVKPKAAKAETPARVPEPKVEALAPKAEGSGHRHKGSSGPSWAEIRKGLSDLGNEFDVETKRASAANTQLSTPSDSSTETPVRLSDLAERSRRARVKRGKLKQSVDSAFDAVKGFIAFPTLGTRGTAWTLPILVLLLWIVFRLAQSRALYIHTSSYFDPLHPSIYQHSSGAGWLEGPLPPAWAPFSIASSHGDTRETFLGFLLRAPLELCESFLLGTEPPSRTWMPS